jgi:4'-phosphopantetheinyl transferase EntD
MRQLGVRDVALVPGPGRAPVWPDGIITYCEGYSAAAVTTTHRFVGLGIDTEPPARTPRPRSTQPCATTRSWSTCRLRNRTRC